MSDVYEHNVGDHEDPLTGPIWIIGFIGAVLMVVIMLGLTALYYNAKHLEEQYKVIEPESEQLERLHTSQLARITASPRYVEQLVRVEGQENDQVVQSLVIPIDQAMEVIVREANRGQQ